jgi:diguanylate cyclase (GGDEF)-like protein
MGDDQLRLYRTLSRAPFPKSYVGKVFLTAFLGTHVPLLTLLVYFARHRRSGPQGGALRILSVTAPATLGGTALTLWAMYSLSAPSALASRALRRYLGSGELPDLPVGYTDRAGRLMADVQYTIERLDKAVRSLGELATRDHLTGTYNRRAAEERLAEDIKRAERGGALSLTLLDLDQLKPVNDAHGHRAGDACVVHFAEVLGRNLRAGDWIARWGGDECVVGMWNTQEGQPTKPVLERIVEDLRESPVVLPGGEETYLTFSGGACRWRPGDDARGLISRADEALYQAKAEGGNTIVHLD